MLLTSRTPDRKHDAANNGDESRAETTFHDVVALLAAGGVDDQAHDERHEQDRDESEQAEHGWSLLQLIRLPPIGKRLGG